MNALKRYYAQFIKWSPLTRIWGRPWGERATLALLAVLIILFVAPLFRKNETSQAIAKWVTVQKGPFTIDIVESGEIQAVNEKIITAPMMWMSSLQIIDLIPEGTHVNEGDTLIQFDVVDLQTNIDLARDRLTTLRADREKLKAQQHLTITTMEDALKVSEYSYEQAQLRLQMREFESDAKKEEARLELKQAEIDLTMQKKQLESQKIIHRSQMLANELSIKQSEDRYDDLKERLTLFTVRAPLSGMVVYKEVGGWESRERLKKGYSARPNEELLSIPDLSKMQVLLYVNEVDRSKIVPGLKARIELDAYPEIELRGTVRNVARLAQKISMDSELKGFQVYVDIDGSDARMKPGMTAKVEVALETYEDKVYVPEGVVFEKEGKPFVFSFGNNKPIQVELGPRNDGFFVVENGLKAGQKLSWTPPEGYFLFGQKDEQDRIDEVNLTLLKSFAVFEERGILHDYFSRIREKSAASGEEKKGMDLSKLPPSLRGRLQGSDSARSAGPSLEVGTPDGDVEPGRFKVTPEMMNRLQNKDNTENSTQKR